MTNNITLSLSEVLWYIRRKWLFPWIRRHDDFYRVTGYANLVQRMDNLPKCPHLYPTPTPHPWCVRVGAAQRDPVRSQSGSCAAWIVSEGCVSEAPLTLKSG